MTFGAKVLTVLALSVAAVLIGLLLSSSDPLALIGVIVVALAAFGALLVVFFLDLIVRTARDVWGRQDEQDR